MSNNLLLVKILAATAWADGEIAPDERTALERIGRDLGLTAEEQEVIRALLASPVGLEQAEAWSAELMPMMTRDERADLLRRMEAVVAADARRDPKETRLLESIRAAVDQAEGGGSFVDRVRGLFRSERKKGDQAPRAGSVVSTLLGRVGERGGTGAVGSQRYQSATLFGAILYRVAFSDGEFTEDEASRLRTMLTGLFGFDDDETEQILSVIVSKAAEDLDRQRLCAAFNRTTEMEGRMRLLGCLFTIAEADGEISDAEMREMRLIANYLWIGARDFHQVRLQHWSEGGWRAN